MAENPNPPAIMLDAFRLYHEIANRQDLTDEARLVIDKYLSGAKEALEKARRVHGRSYRSWWLKEKGSKLGWNEVYQIQDEEIARFQAQRHAEDVRSRSQTNPDSQDVPGVTNNSQRNEPDLNAMIEMDFDGMFDDNAGISIFGTKLPSIATISVGVLASVDSDNSIQQVRALKGALDEDKVTVSIVGEVLGDDVDSLLEDLKDGLATFKFTDRFPLDD
ncbi:hypothetical protein ACHAP8_001061 [Fusarium lateritium]